jgi:oligoribonuclease NrnB/cAMP/cGMP phosphodiesterase (DHH superfamily)
MEVAREFFKDEHIDVIVYHSPCDDGHAAAALFWVKDTNVTLHGLHPKDQLITTEFCKLIHGKNVVFVDIAFSRDAMIRTAELANKVAVLDHHVTNQTILENLLVSNLRTVFLMDVAGVRLAWRFLHGDENHFPPALYYIALKDVWHHEKVPEALYFTTAFSRPTTWDGWIPYIHGMEKTVETVEHGQVIYTYQQSVLKTMMQKVEYLSWRGYRIAIVNVPFPWISDIGALICQTEPKRTIAVIWNKSVTGPYSVSLRSDDTEGPNIEQIALEFKGGGHAHAAGLRLDSPPYEIFKD